MSSIAVPIFLACRGCGESYLRFYFPLIGPALALLVLWRLVYLVYQLRQPAESVHRRSLSWLPVTRIALLLMAFLGANLAGIAIYLLVELLAGIGFSFWQANREESRTNFPRPILLHSAAIALLAIVTVAGWWQNAGLDNLERLRKSTPPDTLFTHAPGKAMAQSPDFDLERLRPLLLSDDQSDRSTALILLRLRKEPAGLIQLADAILQVPEEDSLSGPTYPYHLRHLLDDLGLHNILSHEDLRHWLKQQESALPPAQDAE